MQDTKMIKTVYIDNAGTIHECEAVVFECTECKGSFQIFREENPAYCLGAVRRYLELLMERENDIYSWMINNRNINTCSNRVKNRKER